MQPPTCRVLSLPTWTLPKTAILMPGVATMQEVLNSGVDNNLVLICYSGKTYAQATTNVLSALGYDMSKIYTLEGGFNAWSETYPDNVEA